MKQIQKSINCYTVPKGASSLRLIHLSSTQSVARVINNDHTHLDISRRDTQISDMPPQIIFPALQANEPLLL